MARVEARKRTTRPKLLESQLYAMPVHGQEGRIASVRRALGMSQDEFAEAVDTSRETVSHWENVYPDGDERAGEPRQRTTRSKSTAIADLVRRELDLDMRDDAFTDAGDAPIEVLRRKQDKMERDLTKALDLLEQLVAQGRKKPATR